MCNLTNEELWLVVRLYFFAVTPIFLVSYLLFRKKINYNTIVVLALTFFICAFGFEIWLTYGLMDGLPVSLRRSEALNCAVPQDLNWILNSLGDVLIVWIGLFIVRLIFSKSFDPDHEAGAPPTRPDRPISARSPGAAGAVGEGDHGLRQALLEHDAHRVEDG